MILSIERGLMDIKKYDLIIVGGGISGLASAYFCQRRNAEQSCLLLEASNRLGGKIRSENVNIDTVLGKQTFLLEYGPDSFASQRWEIDALLQDLELEDEVITPQTHISPLWILRRNGLSPFPEGFRILPQKIKPLVTTSLLSLSGKLRAAAELFIRATATETDESVASFIHRRFGREVLENFSEPLIAGIFHARPERQSIMASFPHLRELERKDRSILWSICKRRFFEICLSASSRSSIKDKSPFKTLRRGMSTLTDALESALRADIATQTAVLAISPRVDSLWEVELSDGTRVTGRNIILTTPAFTSAVLIEEHYPVLSKLLASISYAQTALITFIVEKKSIPFAGSGIISAKEAQTPINAITISSEKFNYRSPEKYSIVRASIGGSRNPELLSNPDSVLINIVHSELERIFKKSLQPIHTDLQRWPRAVPIFEVGHQTKVQSILTALPNRLTLAGNYLKGTGIPDAIKSAKRAVSALYDRDQS
jgi:oxygen-dependent protoporphyrinogen oxidase